MHKQASNFQDLINKKFNRLTVIEFAHTKNRRAYWLCLCDCGNTTIVIGSKLKSDYTRSCGCLNKESMSAIGKQKKTHGLSKTRFYRIWINMYLRCNSLNDINYMNYGGRGITVCPRWLESFENFRDDLYKSYLDHVKEFGEKDTSIDRIDVNGNYEPSNVRWSTNTEQVRNMRTSSQTTDYSEHAYWRNRLISSISCAIQKKLYKSKLAEFYLGCSLGEFRSYIQFKFYSNMSWDNHGKNFNKWQLDHIIGCNNFDLSKEEDRLICFNYKNYQPLWHEDHIKKSTHRLVKGLKNG